MNVDILQAVVDCVYIYSMMTILAIFNGGGKMADNLTCMVHAVARTNKLDAEAAEVPGV